MVTRFTRGLMVFFWVLAGFAQAGDLPAPQALAQSLLRLAGTTAVFDSPPVQSALANPQPYVTGKLALEDLVIAAGLKPWQSPRIWLLKEQPQDGKSTWVNMGGEVDGSRRGLRFSQLAPLPTASDALGFLQPNQPNPGLTGLLAAYDADVLVLVRGDQWSIWGLPFRVGGQLPLNRRILLPDVLAETLAMAAQWPMARGRNVISVYGAINLADFAGVQTALRGLPEVNQLQLLQTSADHLLFAVANPLTIAFDAALTVDAHFADMSRSNILPASVWEARRLAGLMRAKLWQMPIDLPAAAPSPNSIN